MIYLNIPEVNGSGGNTSPGNVLVINGATVNSAPTNPASAIVNTFIVPIASCSGPQGMAIGPAPQILLGCNGGPAQEEYGQPTAIIDDGSTGNVAGSVFATLKHQAGSDEVDYNAFLNIYELGASSFNPPQPNGVASCFTSPITADRSTSVK